MIATAAAARVTATLSLIMHICDTRTNVLVEFFGPAHIVDARAARFLADRLADADGTAAPRHRGWTMAPGSQYGGGFAFYTADADADLAGLPQVDALLNPTEEECEHGLSAWLCAGPSHYPMDM